MKILSNEVADHFKSSSFKRGHMVFTSLIKKNGKVLFIDDHIERLLKGSHFLFPHFLWNERHEKLRAHILEILNNDIDQYLRLTVFDDILMTEKTPFIDQHEVIKMTNAQKIKTPDLLPSFLKQSNYLLADLELLKANERGFNEVLFLDTNQNAQEASTSNIFVIDKNHLIKTPPASSMVLDGVLRKNLLKKINELGYKISIEEINVSELKTASEIWLTNSVRGLRFVNQYDDYIFNYENSLFSEVTSLLGKFGEKI